MGPAFPSVNADLLRVIGQRLLLPLRARWPAATLSLRRRWLRVTRGLILVRVASLLRGYVVAYDHSGV